MSNVRYRTDRRRWEVRRSVKDPLTGKTKCLCRLLPPNTTRRQALQVGADFDRQAHHIRLARFNPSAAILTAGRAYLSAWKTHSAESYRHYAYTLKKFLLTLPSDIVEITQITPLHISLFISSILNEGFKPRTANARLTVVKSFCRWCSKIYGISNAAAAVGFLLEEPPNRRYLTDAELALISSSVTPDVGRRFQFLANTGLRSSELCNLVWGNISENRQSMSLMGKGYKVRVIPLNQTCRDILDHLCKTASASPQPNLPIFFSKSTRCKLTRSGLYNTCNKISTRLSIPSFGPHAFRHYFATKLITSGVPLAIVSKILGHASTDTTERIYTHILPADLAGATECLCHPPQ